MTHPFPLRYVSVLLIISLITSCNPLKERLTVNIAEKTYHLELAYTRQKRSTGLMFRKAITENEGMLFFYPEASIRWYIMKNCLVDIDLIYLNKNGIIVALHKMTVEPPAASDETEIDYTYRLKHYSSEMPAQFVIELKAGQIQAQKLAVGDLIQLPFNKLKQYPSQH